MKLSPRSLVLALVRHVQRLKPPQASLERWLPRPAPALVPSPVRTNLHARSTRGRPPYRGG